MSASREADDLHIQSQWAFRVLPDIFCISPTSDPGRHPLCLESSTPSLRGIPGASELSFSSDDPFQVLVRHPLLTYPSPQDSVLATYWPFSSKPLFVKINYLFWLRWVFVLSMSSRCAGSKVVALGLSCSEAGGIFPDPGNPTRVSCTARQILYHCWTTGKVHSFKLF